MISVQWHHTDELKRKRKRIILFGPRNQLPARWSVDEASGYRIYIYYTYMYNNFNRHSQQLARVKTQTTSEEHWLTALSLSTLVGGVLPGICLSNKRLSTGNLDNPCEWKLMIRSEGESRNSGYIRGPVTRVSCQHGFYSSPCYRRRCCCCCCCCCCTLLKEIVSRESRSDRSRNGNSVLPVASGFPRVASSPSGLSGDTISRDSTRPGPLCPANSPIVSTYRS